MYHHIRISAHVEGKRMLLCDITCPSPCLHISCNYPKGVADYANVCAQYVFSRYELDGYRYIVITNKLVCTSSKHDDQGDNQMNTLAFINFYSSKFSQP